MDLNWILIFFLTFGLMEFAAWFLHKYVMHGFLWVLHLDHHQHNPNRSYQLNDFFAFFFAVPSFLFILFDHLYSRPYLGAVGFGIMAYGIAYFLVHEIVIHRRWKLFNIRNSWYVEAVNAAHKVHHSILGKEGCSNFGMLIVPIKYFRNARQRRKSN